MAQKPNPKGSESSADTSPATVTHYTVNAVSNYAQFTWDTSLVVDAEEGQQLMNDGFKARIAAVTGRLDAKFGNFGHKGPDGKTVKRPANWSRSDVQYNAENAAIVQNTIATSDSKGRTIACTVSRYVPTVIATVDQATVVMAKNLIVAKSTDGETLRAFANTVEFYGDDLSVNNGNFVSKVVEFITNRLTNL